MGCVIALLRVLGRLVLGLAIFAGLLHFLVISNFTQRLVDSEVYDVAISDTDAYNRIYDEVLVDDALSDESQDLVGGLEIDAQEEAVELLRQVMPPSYLQEQTEDNIDRFTGFLNGDVDRLEIYVELKEPLERLEPTVEAEVYRYIDELEIVEAREPGCSPATIAWLATNAAKPLDQISNGELPESAPSLLAMTRECRESQFEAWFERVVTNVALSSQTSILLQSAKEDLREPFEEGDTRAFLKAAVTPLIGPLVEDAVSNIRRELKPGDQLDLIEKVVEESEDFTREDLDEQAEGLRDVLAFSNGTGRVIALALIVVGVLLLAAVHLPEPAQVLRWPGVSLTLGGGVCLIAGFVMNSAIPNQLNRAVTYSTSFSADVPASSVNLAGDLLESFGRQATAGFLTPALVVLVLGVALIAASFGAEALMDIVKRVLPWPRNRD